MSSFTPVLVSVTPIGVGFDTARYGHHVTFLRADLQPACLPFEFPESHAGYDRVRQAFAALHQRFPAVHFHVRLDAAGQYATNLETFLRGLPFPSTLSVGEPARNRDYRKAIFPKRKADPVESLCAARFALVEQPPATPPTLPAYQDLREIAQRLQSQVRQSTRLTNQLHNVLARVFPELAVLAADLQAGWVLQLLARYPTPARLARAHLASLTAIPFVTEDKALLLQTAAAASVASVADETAGLLVERLVKQLRASQADEEHWLRLLAKAYHHLPQANYLTSIPGIGIATAAVLTAKIVAIDRFAGPAQLVSYFGVFPQEDASGLSKDGCAKPGKRTGMSAKGNDLVRRYLWNAARSAATHNPAVRALFHRLRSRGVRGDVALGHCMRKLLHLVYAVWRTNKPFDPAHYPWEASEPVGPAAAQDKAAGHNQERVPEGKVVTAADSKVSPGGGTDQPKTRQDSPAAAASPAGSIDYAALRQQIRMEDVLAHLGCLTTLKGSGQQRRGACPIHARNDSHNRSFSVHLGKKAFQCFHPPCGIHGNALDLWAAVRGLPLYEAALDLANTLNIALPGTSGTEKRNP